MDFFDMSLTTQKFTINGEAYNVCLQMWIMPLQNTPNNILVLESQGNNQNLKIVAWDGRLREVRPIAYSDAEEIIGSIKKMSFDNDFIQKCISALTSVTLHSSDIPRFEVLNEGVEMLIIKCPKSSISDKYQVEVEFDSVKLTPSRLVYGALNGLYECIYFELKVSQIELIRNWGILSPIRLYVDELLSGEYYAQNTNLLERVVSFECEPQIGATLKRQIAGHMRAQKIDIVDISDFLVSTAGLENMVAFPKGYPNASQWYIVATPVLGLAFEKDFGIGNVVFCTASSEEITHIREFAPQLSEYDSFALVNVNSDTLYHAFTQAKNQIDQAVDLLVNILKDDSLYSVHSIGQHLLHRDSTAFNQKISIPFWVYIELPFTGGKLVYDYAEIIMQKKLRVQESFREIQHELSKIELLLLKANGTNDKELTPLFNSLKWIRRAWDAEDSDDKVIYSIIALEFIVSKEPNSPMMEKALRKKCKGAIRKIIDDTKNLPAEKILYSQNVCAKFDRVYTETPFMEKLRNLINRLNIPVSAADMDLIAKCRKQRNEIVHGENNSKLPANDIYRLCECIGRIAFYKLVYLEEQL